MPLFQLRPSFEALPVLNSACPWASSSLDLERLYKSLFTSAVTTRTSTLHGFPDDPTEHQMTFFSPASSTPNSTFDLSTINSFGFSPFTTFQYLEWLRPLLIDRSLKKKIVIISIAGELEEVKVLLEAIKAFAQETDSVLGVEFNASCPNIKDHPPPAYDPECLIPLLSLLQEYSSPRIKPGLKLPPYTTDTQFTSMIDCLEGFSKGLKEHPIAFLTATNTLGQGLVFAHQMCESSSPVAQKRIKNASLARFALPSPTGGLAGSVIHQLSLGNIYKLRRLLDESAKEFPAMGTISLIGVGGVSDRAGARRMWGVGADAVAIASALGAEGGCLSSKIVDFVFERVGKGASMAKL